MEKDCWLAPHRGTSAGIVTNWVPKKKQQRKHKNAQKLSNVKKLILDLIFGGGSPFWPIFANFGQIFTHPKAKKPLAIQLPFKRLENYDKNSSETEKKAAVWLDSRGWGALQLN